jgi:XapX domain-containing protein
MKVLLVSLAVGLLVGILYGLIRVKSPAPPIVALVGLLRMVLGEQFGGWILAKKVDITLAATVCLVSKHWDRHPKRKLRFNHSFARSETLHLRGRRSVADQQGGVLQ